MYAFPHLIRKPQVYKTLQLSIQPRQDTRSSESVRQLFFKMTAYMEICPHRWYTSGMPACTL